DLVGRRVEARCAAAGLICFAARHHPMRCEVEPARCDLEHRGRAGRTIGTSPFTYYSPPNANYTHLFVELGRAGRAKARGAADWRAGGFFLAPPTKVFLRLMPVGVRSARTPVVRASASVPHQG